MAPLSALSPVMNSLEAKPRRKLPKKRKANQASASNAVQTTESETQTDVVCVPNSVMSEERDTDSDSEELRQRQVEQQLLQLKIARNLREAEEMAKVDSSRDSDEDD